MCDICRERVGLSGVQVSRAKIFIIPRGSRPTGLTLRSFEVLGWNGRKRSEPVTNPRVLSVLPPFRFAWRLLCLDAPVSRCSSQRPLQLTAHPCSFFSPLNSNNGLPTFSSRVRFQVPWSNTHPHRLTAHTSNSRPRPWSCPTLATSSAKAERIFFTAKTYHLTTTQQPLGYPLYSFMNTFAPNRAPASFRLPQLAAPPSD
ncbi:hypothetical protein BT67DRAFT_115124 [Trichocladium antarcticum]|uniref:Uncharacterized protein n=1 Tax=Trichocladium antarcticum TaxID=1450529 RepID=A0AAN6ZGJ1_9PEZI|nr:hypothetical protein BT67DRAFT_115124 [Trichocladium antarcticum]